MSTTAHPNSHNLNTDQAASPVSEVSGSTVTFHGSIYVYSGLTLGANDLATNTGNVVFVEQGAYLTNYGTVSSSAGVGVSLYGDTTLSNMSSGLITTQSAAAVTAYGAGIDIANAGTITSASGQAVYFTGSGSITNGGVITSGSGYGIAQSQGTASVTNYAGATIYGGNVGVEISSGTITNDGTISGSNYAVDITGTGTLVDETGSVFTGSVTAYAGNGSVLQLAGSGTGTLNGLGTQFTGFDTLTIASGTWTINQYAPAPGAIYNYSVVTGGATGVGLSVYTGGFLYNADGATITAQGAAAISANGYSLSVINDGGLITSTNGAGIYLSGSGTIANYGGTIASGTGYGISASGGTAYITNTGYIGGGSVGVEIAGGTITNSGTISGGSYAVSITGAGTLVVDPGAVFNGQVAGTPGYGDVLDLAGSGTGTLAGLGTQFTGFDTLSVTSGTWTVQNAAPFYGTINNYSVLTGGASGVGISVYAGGTLYNAAGATIESNTAAAVSANGSSITITNDGLINSASGFGIYLDGDGTIANAGTISSGTGYGISANDSYPTYVTNYGLISGGNVGVSINNGTITNAGTISGGNYAVQIAGTGTLVDDAGSVFIGTVAAYAGGGSTLDLAAGTGIGTLAGLGTQFTGFGTLDISAGATWTIENGGDFAGVIINDGVVTGGASGNGLSVIGGSLYNTTTGTIEAQSGTAVAAKGAGFYVENGGLITSASGIGLSATGDGTITNNGSISSATGTGVVLSFGAYAVNYGYISGGAAGVQVTGATLTNISTGTIISGSGAGVSAGGADIINDGYIDGVVGVQISTGTITNGGTISGSTDAIKMTGTGTLVVESGAVFNGTVAATLGKGDVLAFAANTYGTLSGFGIKFSHFASVYFGAGTDWTLQTSIGGSKVTTFSGSLSGNDLEVTNGGTLTSALGSGFGTLELTGASSFTVASNLTLSAGELLIDAGTDLVGAGTLTAITDDNGTILAKTGAELTLASSITGSGVLSTHAGGTLAVAGGFDWSGNLNGAGTILLLSDGTLENSETFGAATVVQSANVTLASGITVSDQANSWTFSTSSSTDTLALAGSSASTFVTGGTVTVTGGGTTDVQTTLATTPKGHVNVESGTFSLLGGLSNQGTISALNGSTINVAPVASGIGTLVIGAASTLNLEDGSRSSQIVDFAANGSSLDLTSPSSFLGTIAGFSGSDQIDLLNTAVTSLSFTHGVLSVLDGNIAVASLHFSGAYTTSSFATITDNHGGTLLTFV